MIATTRRRHLSLSALTLPCVVLLAGCLDAEVNECVRYDSKTDSFHVLKLYTHVYALSEPGSQHLAAIWRNRDHLILGPAMYYPQEDEEIAVIGVEPSLVRVGAKGYYVFNTVANAEGEKATLEQSPFPLDAIVIRPGTFFLSPEKTLCYYHEVVIPGKFVDEIIAWMDRDIRRSMAESAKAERDRREGSDRRLSWEEFRKQVDADPSEAYFFDYLDDESLEALSKKAAEDGKLLARDGLTLQLSLPLSAADCRELAASFDRIKKVLAKELRKEIERGTKEMKLPERGLISKSTMEALLVSIAGPQCQARVDGKRVVMSLDASVVLAAMEPKDLDFGKPKADKQQQYRDTIAYLRKHEVPIDEQLTPAEVAAAFKEGRLKSHPSPNPLDPGEGLVK